MYGDDSRDPRYLQDVRQHAGHRRSAPGRAARGDLRPDRPQRRGVNTFAMLARLASGTPPPLWQVWISMSLGLAAAAAVVWFAAKIFKIGLLMQGKPPNFTTLVRWARMA
jgi:hypothetical protein